jgi:hypothetical protein
MAVPTDPTPGPGAPLQPSGPQQQQPQPTSYLDPTGAWQKFLSAGGATATPQEVQMFMQGMLKMFNVLIQQQNEAYHRSNEQLKKAEEGDE